MLFFIKIDWKKRLLQRDKMLYVLIAALLIAAFNLFWIGSNKGCILILADFLLILYMSSEIRISDLQRKVLTGFFLLMYFSWFVYDRAYSYNANTGATYTVFTLFAALFALKSLTDRKEIYGYFIVIAFLRTGTLVLWHLARGAFFALVFFVFFYALFYLMRPDRFKKAYIFLCCFAVFGSLLFVWCYVQLSATGFNARMPFFYKNIFSGREQIWKEIWDMLKQHLLTGIGSGYELKSFFEYNIHNAMYDILAVHGLIVFALSAVLIIRRLTEAGKYACTDTHSRIAEAAVFAIFFESFIDMDLMWADYSPVLLFLFLEVFRGKRRENV